MTFSLPEAKVPHLELSPSSWGKFLLPDLLGPACSYKAKYTAKMIGNKLLPYQSEVNSIYWSE